MCICRNNAKQKKIILVDQILFNRTLFKQIHKEILYIMLYPHIELWFACREGYQQDGGPDGEYGGLPVQQAL